MKIRSILEFGIKAIGYSIFILVVGCHQDECEPNIVVDLSSIKIYGDVTELQYPVALKTNPDIYAQIPVAAITVFKDRIKNLQFDKADFDNAEEIDSMIVNPQSIQTTTNLYKTYGWRNIDGYIQDYYQVSEVGNTYYFDYLHNCCFWATEVDNAWQLKDYSQGYMLGKYWTTTIAYNWIKNDTAVSFVYDDYGYYPWEGIKYEVVLNKRDFSGSVIQSHYDGWSIEVTWDVAGKGNWIHNYADGSKAIGSF